MKIKYNPKTKQWDELEPYSKEGIYFSPRLFEKIKSMIEIRKKGWDNIFIIDGPRRSGKSTLGITIGFIMDPTFSLDNIAVGTDDAAQKIKNLPDEAILLIDEGSLVLSAKDVMKKEQKRLMKIIDVVGQKRMTLIIILPTFFDLARAIAVTHSRFLLHVYTDQKLQRGRFSYFGEKKKRILYEVGKKHFGSYRQPEAGFIDKFVDYNPLGDAYLKLKRRALIEALGTDQDDRAISKTKRQRDVLLYYLYMKRYFTQDEMSNLLGSYGVRMSRRNISLICNKIKDERARETA